MAKVKTCPDYTLGSVVEDGKETKFRELSIKKAVRLEVQESDNHCMKGDCDGDYCISGG